ncbi:hypothetical protein BWD09_12750 [Neisseria dentiae]|uniref:Uncharacterized protein n=1 Tax=Neisseria dentiae TaxID=194197 RepID=A0A1X3D1S0_9NEIS|nr:hypothetical protein [Neisseria dentiae]OSI13716.1 hypothetical protein BWD09_12750 [Neisseria dentiae]QMT44910.1 hypothetical protein H3L92_10890 [Neisseria dentiae]STZ50646.1 Uncharacterised protein [Neisseria dentiae]
MAIRNDIYTLYKGKECRIGRVDGHYEIVSYEAESLDMGFTEYKPEKNLNPRIFFKIVSPEEVGEVYDIGTFAIYRGYEFWIELEWPDEYVLLGNNNLVLMNKLQFKRVDKFEYKKIVKKEDVDLVYEKKELITDFFD